MTFLLGFLIFSFFTLLLGIVLAPRAINKALVKEKNVHRFEILQIPNIYLKKWYEPEKLTIRKLVILGTIGVILGFLTLYIFVSLV